MSNTIQGTILSTTADSMSNRVSTSENNNNFEYITNAYIPVQTWDKDIRITPNYHKKIQLKPTYNISDKSTNILIQQHTDHKIPSKINRSNFDLHCNISKIDNHHRHTSLIKNIPFRKNNNTNHGKEYRKKYIPY